MSMLSNLRTKIRALVEDFTKIDFEILEYTNSKIFTLSESNISSITKVLKNGSELGSGQYSYDSDTNKIEITTSLIQKDIIEVDYSFTKYSDTELNGYITASLVWISINNCCDKDYELEEDINSIVPTPDNRDLDLISIITAIIIKPNYSIYRLPNLTVRYPRNKSKEEKIRVLIMQFNSGLGISGVLEFN